MHTYRFLYRLLLIIFVATVLVGCNKDKDGGPTAPTTVPATPGGQPQATDRLVLDFRWQSEVHYTLIFRSTSGDLKNAFKLQRNLQLGEESWSGALLWVFESTTGHVRVTDMPFDTTAVPVDHFTLRDLPSRGNAEVHLKFELQPGGSTDRIPILLEERNLEMPGGFTVRNNVVRGFIPRP